MGYPTKLREAWNKQMWTRKVVKPVVVPEHHDPIDFQKDKSK
jgi:hypothetical protein